MSMNNSTWSPTELDQLAVNAIRFLAVDAVERAGSGHPGMPMGAAAMAYVLWTRHLRFNPANPYWFNRARFILSAGHGSMLLYALLYLTGYQAMSMDQLQNFRQWGSHTPGHPERHLDAGIEVTTGPLGQGFASGVGMAIADAHLGACFNRPGYDLVDHYTYALVSDGDLMEGISSEAGSLAGHLKLGKLIYLYDDNNISLSGATDLTFTEDVAKRFEAFGWHTQVVDDGNDLLAIDAAISAARAETAQPSLILCRTHIGYGSPHKHDTFHAHGEPLGAEEAKLTKENLGWPLEPDFYVPDEVLAHFRAAEERGKQWEKEWQSRLQGYAERYPDLAREFARVREKELPAGWDADIPFFPSDLKGMATRAASGQVLNAIAPRLPVLVGGSADLNPSTNTGMKDQGDFKAPGATVGDMQGAVGGGWGYTGRNIEYGVREHAMAAISNGIAAHGGLLPFCATFLIFSDYMRPPMRLAALSHMKVIYVFTHDGIGIGQDGPTHQPVEQLANLRAVPHLTVIRPCDANETAVAWRLAIEMSDNPVALILTRQSVPTFDRRNLGTADELRKGAYILSEAANQRPDILLIATGSEVHLILEAQAGLLGQGVNARVISMPSWELFEAQPPEYRHNVLPPEVKKRLAVETGSPQGWYKYVGDEGDIIGVTDFGASAPGPTVMEHLGFTVENVVQHALEMLGRG